MKKIIVAIITLITVVLGVYLYYREGSLPANPKNNKTQIFVISRGESVNQITKKLYNEDLIRDKIVFFLIVKRLGLENKIQAGDFRLSPSMSASEIAKTLTKGTLDIWVTAIEGLRKEEVAQIISQNLGLPETEFIKKAKEGYLFPDTYLVPRTATIEGVLAIFENNFNRKYDETLKNQTRQKGLIDNEVITLASLVEKEARSYQNRVKVASIIFKRYKNDWPLDIDATVQYALGYQPQEKTWWKKNLTKDDLVIKSPYNTYKNRGIPPGPICNPGLSSIKAVLMADENTPYWYYISSKDGSTMHYAETIEEHNENVRKYLR